MRINNIPTHVLTPLKQAKADKAGFNTSGSKNINQARAHSISLDSASLMGMEALLMMQETDDGQRERRRRQLRRATHVLDALDDLKIGLMDGNRGDMAALNKLISQPLEETGDEKLDALLGHIETLAWVEIAKRSRQ